MSESLFNSERGQFITLSSLLIAVVIVGAVGVAYTGISSYEDRRAGVSAHSDVKTDIGDVTDMMEDTLIDINHDDSISSLTERKDEFNESIESLENNGLTDGTYINISNSTIEYTTGYRIVDPNATTNLSQNGNKNWTVVEDATDVNQIMVRFDPHQLPTADENTTKFEIETEGGDKQIEIFENATTGDVVLANKTERICEFEHNPSGNNVTVDLLNGLASTPQLGVAGVEGTPTTGTTRKVGGGSEKIHCSGHSITESVNKVEIEFGGSTVGTMGVRHRDGTAGAEVTSISEPPAYGANTGVVQTKIIYSAVVDVTMVKEGTAVTYPVVISPGVNHKPPT